jgi:hypothetical protein
MAMTTTRRIAAMVDSVLGAVLLAGSSWLIYTAYAAAADARKAGRFEDVSGIMFMYGAFYFAPAAILFLISAVTLRWKYKFAWIPQVAAAIWFPGGFTLAWLGFDPLLHIFFVWP